MTDHEIYVHEFGPEVAACIERTIQAEREIGAEVAGARGGSAGSARAGEQSSSGAHSPSDELSDCAGEKL